MIRIRTKRYIPSEKSKFGIKNTKINTNNLVFVVVEVIETL